MSRDLIVFSVLVLLALAGLAYYLLPKWRREQVIFDFQKGLLFRNGRHIGVLDAGKHVFYGRHIKVELIDMRPTQLYFGGSDVLTKDNISFKVTPFGFCQVIDPLPFFLSSAQGGGQAPSLIQERIRSLLATVTLEEFLADQNGFADRVLADTEPQARANGFVLPSLSLHPVLPISLKKAFSAVLEAQKEAQKQIEKARGETAVLRHLANVASLYEQHPKLLEARLVQTLSASTNSVVFTPDTGLRLNDKVPKA